MVVGEILSELVDGKEKKLNFKMEELETDEAQWFKSLVHIADEVGPTDSILSATPKPPQATTSSLNTKPRLSRVSKPKPKAEPKISTLKPRAIIEEIDTDGEEEEDEDLAPYAKASDPEDSDDDATLIQRNKLKPPVYIRDLVTFLRDSESYDKQKLALQTAPVLIRRKANFGTEVSSHADELANLLVGAQDKFDIEGFDDLKLQSMISLVVAQPKIMAPWFARTFFEGDYSLSQRTSVLITLGLSAREIAGFETSKYQSEAAFPTKRLPEAMEKLYLASSSKPDRLPASQLKALPATALDTIADSITSAFLAPLAAKAADATSGPDVLKLQSFTARYKSTVKDRPRFRAIPNTTANLLANNFFSPLTAHFQFALRSSKAVVLNPVLLGIYLQTLGIIIHSAGPSTLSLPQLTSELWNLLLGVRIHAVKDLSSLKGWLIAMAALLEVNEGDMRKLCESQGREIVETREWVGHVFERTRGEDGGEENDVKMLAAGVLLRLGEAIEKYQALLMGDMIGFT
jgi:telomere length regulation protein